MGTGSRTVRAIWAAVTVVASVMAVVSPGGSQPGEANGPESLRYEAGRTRGSFFDTTGVKVLTDSVIAWHRDAILSAFEGVYESGTGIIRFRGRDMVPALFSDSVRHIEADSLVYYEKTGIAMALGDVIVTEGDRILMADSVRYRKDEQILEAFGNVTVRDDSMMTAMTGREATFNDSTGHGLVIGEPVLMKEDADGSVISVACSDTIEVFREERMTRLWNAVVMTKDSVRVTADQAFYDDADEVVTFHGAPTAEYMVIDHREGAPSTWLVTTTTVAGDTMLVHLRDREIRGADVIGAAVSTTASADSAGALFELSVIESETMNMMMDDEGISSITAIGTAESYYQRAAFADTDKFVNVAAGDTLSFAFSGGQVTTITIAGYGGSPGKGHYYSYKPATAIDDSAGTAESEPAL